jgi:hypothetical protein
MQLRQKGDRGWIEYILKHTKSSSRGTADRDTLKVWGLGWRLVPKCLLARCGAFAIPAAATHSLVDTPSSPCLSFPKHAFHLRSVRGPPGQNYSSTHVY